jgi:hypothetical protein
VQGATAPHRRDRMPGQRIDVRRVSHHSPMLNLASTMDELTRLNLGWRAALLP